MFRTFAEAESFLRTREDFERRARGGWRPDLGPARALAAALGEPQRRYRVLHVGGPKGKGSTATFLAEVLRSSGRRVGLYTSPHLERVTERIVVDGEEIGAEGFVAAVGRAARVAEAGGEAGRASTFDVLTAAAFDHFARTGVEWAVVEVGLGGRLDSTSVVEPEACVLTNVSLEHTEVLGDRIEDIAREKAGIVRAGIPVVTGFEGGALPVLEAACRERGARLLRRGREFGVESVERADGGGLRVGLRTWNGRYGPVALPGSGLFQAENLAFAVAALEAARERGVLPGLDLDALLAEAAPRLAVHGRFEIFPGDPPIVLDGAHTPESVEAALESLEGAFPGRRTAVVFGAQSDKDLRGMSSRLRGRADTVVLTALATPRAASLPALVAVAREEGLPFVEEDPGQALEVAAGRAGREGVVLALGSLHLVGALRPAVARDRRRRGGPQSW